MLFSGHNCSLLGMQLKPTILRNGKPVIWITTLIISIISMIAVARGARHPDPVSSAFTAGLLVHENITGGFLVADANSVARKL
jgi:hypothetical protein